jgi:hypothetical protein
MYGEESGDRAGVDGDKADEHVPLHRIELGIERLEPSVDPLEPSVDPLEAFIDLFKPFIDLVESPVHFFEALIDLLEALPHLDAEFAQIAVDSPEGFVQLLVGPSFSLHTAMQPTTGSLLPTVARRKQNF